MVEVVEEGGGVGEVAGWVGGVRGWEGRERVKGIGRDGEKVGAPRAM